MSNLKSKLEELGPLMEKPKTDENEDKKISDEILEIEKFFTEKHFELYVEFVNFSYPNSFILMWCESLDGQYRLMHLNPDSDKPKKPLIETPYQIRKSVYPYLLAFLDAVKTELTKGEKDEPKS